MNKVLDKRATLAGFTFCTQAYKTGLIAKYIQSQPKSVLCMVSYDRDSRSCRTASARKEELKQEQL